MKKYIYGCILFFLLTSIACTKETIVDYPVVKIEVVIKNDLSVCSVMIIPSENTLRFKYAVATEDNRAEFELGTLEGIYEQEGSEPLEVTFENVSTNDGLTIFAQAFNDSGSGPVASVKPYSVKSKFNVSLQYVTHCSAGVKFDMSGSYYKCKYYLGHAGESEAFLNDNVKASYLEESQYWVVNFFDLEESSDYILYVKGTDRAYMETPLLEIPISTCAFEEFPAIEFKTNTLDVMGGIFEFVPNNQCGKIVATYAKTAGQFDSMLYSDAHFYGDCMYMLSSWSDAGINDWCKTSKANQSLNVELNTASCLPEEPIEFYILVYDKEQKPFGCYYYSLKTPVGDESAPLANVSIKISDITSSGATYTFTADENTVLFYYETVDADWFDDFVTTDQYYDYFIHEYLRQGNGMLARGEKIVAFVENKAEPSKRYYAVACPMNLNGVAGWSPIVLESYTTLSK